MHIFHAPLALLPRRILCTTTKQYLSFILSCFTFVRCWPSAHGDCSRFFYWHFEWVSWDLLSQSIRFQCHWKCLSFFLFISLFHILSESGCRAPLYLRCHTDTFYIFAVESEAHESSRISSDLIFLQTDSFYSVIIYLISSLKSLMRKRPSKEWMVGVHSQKWR